MKAHREWGRSPLSQEFCRIWDWRTATGHLKDMACRSLLNTLEERGHLALPPVQSHPRWVNAERAIKDVAPRADPIEGPLSVVSPIEMVPAGPASQPLLAYLLARYHYPGIHRTVDENMKYLVGSPLIHVGNFVVGWKYRYHVIPCFAGR